jgi:serine/threonine protein kinase
MARSAEAQQQAVMKSCAQCGAEVGADAEGTQCAACLLRIALDEPADSVEDADLLVGGEPHRLLGPIGRGPNGTSYIACSLREPSWLATVKVIEQPVDVDDFLRRMDDVLTRMGGLAEGDNGPRSTGVMADGRPYVSCPYVPGRAIDQCIARAVTARDSLGLLVSVCSDVAALHARDVVHGSIKPSNVIVTGPSSTPAVTLLDAGVRPSIEAAWLSRRTATRSREMPQTRQDDVDALRRLVSALVERRSDLARVRSLLDGHAASASGLAHALRSAMDGL